MLTSQKSCGNTTASEHTSVTVENPILTPLKLSTNEIEEASESSDNHLPANYLASDDFPRQEMLNYQIDNLSEGRSEIEEMRRSFSRVTYLYCLLIVVGVLAATTITFCVTRSSFSFTMLTILAYIHRLRKREESYLYPLSERDFLLEITKIKKYRSGTDHTQLAWIQRLFRK